MGKLLFILVLYFFPTSFTAEAQLNSTPTVPVSYSARVKTNERDPLKSEIDIKNVSGMRRPQNESDILRLKRFLLTQESKTSRRPAMILWPMF